MHNRALSGKLRTGIETQRIFLCKGKLLKKLKLPFDPVINFATKTTVIGLFNFRAFLNIEILLAESERAKQLRSLILDMVIASIHERTRGGTKHINRRDTDYLPSAIAEVKYRKILTLVISRYVAGHPFQQSHLHNTRTKMASCNLGFRDALHHNIAEYI